MPFVTFFHDLAEARTRIQPGRMFTVRVGGLPFRVCVVRRPKPDGEDWFAFADVCPHKKASFAQGGWITAQGGVVCPLHQYVFDMATGQEVTNYGCADLRVFQVRATDPGGLEVDLPL